MTTIKSITGYDDYLYHHMKESFKKAKKIDIIVSFLMESGVKLLEQDLIELKTKNIPIRILTGNYLNITQPSALYRLKDIFGDSADLRFFNEPNRSFHAKSYFFEYEDGADMYIGSSNLSKSAFTSGVEWNFKLDKLTHQVEYERYHQVFEDLFYNHSIKITDAELDFYSKNWKKNKIYQTTPFPNTNFTEVAADEAPSYVTDLYSPRGAQIEALYHLKKTREEGFDKGLVVAATGIGKTYLAAFDSREYKRILFVAHREEILKQAEKSFKNVRPMSERGFFIGNQKDTTKDIIFASVQSLGKNDSLKLFQPDYFDYIIVDEFHHAVAQNYQNIIQYFKPKFLLGLTATPERLDSKDVLAICDYNLVYEAPLKKAINQGWLVPFRYYAIFDETVNYETIDYRNGKYQTTQLEEALSIHKRADLIFSHYKKYRSTRAMGFCMSKHHAEFMADYFVKHGVSACAVYSGDEGVHNTAREKALSKLVKGEINVIFSVDMFNEGLDIASLDMVMMLRPTESPTIFLQQLGRGLRLYKDKHYLNVLDFIGNYKKANFSPYLMTGASKSQFKKASDVIKEDSLLPEDCIMDFDFRLIDLFEKMDRSSIKIEKLLVEEYERIKAELGHRPSRTELFTYMDETIYLNIKSKAKINPFKNYLNFLKNQNDLSDEEIAWLDTPAVNFINMIEKTSMSKTYKLPTILAFIKNGRLELKINDDDLYESFNDFYSHGSNAVDLLRDKNSQTFKEWGKAEYVKLARKNPVHFLCQSESEFFSSDEEFMYLTNSSAPYQENLLFIQHIKDAIELRKQEFYKNRLEKLESK
ncbi:DEAD/DEAH box helicase family protein [Turicibacter sp. H121]|uniref:DEAD/DEAH box helicase family protein n=1 Tax=Turicibacter sp. H121 TaxID=1712675 RepID=UPI00190FE72C|nr:DEAD/DEAH box helicase family protein [Turicibacter sp. H121]MCU7200307.1 DEAD/DEAH box helicase family protein [Turicibacter sp. H121]